MGNYKNYKGEDVDIGKLSNRDLVLLYRFFQKFSNSIEATLVTLENKDTSFGNYVLNMVSTRDVLKAEIKSRKIKLSHYSL